MRCLECGSQAVTERPERTAQGYRRFRCRTCGKQFNERSGTLLNRTQYPSDVIALVVLWRLRYKLSLRDLPEMFAVRGIVFSHEAVREWEAKLTPALAEALRQRRRGKVGRSWTSYPLSSLRKGNREGVRGLKWDARPGAGARATYVDTDVPWSGSNRVCRCSRTQATPSNLSATPRRARP
jgi:hypothetical protein